MPKNTINEAAPTSPGENGRKKGAFQIAQEPVTAGNAPEGAAPEASQPSDEAQRPQAPAFEDLGSLPATYHQDHLFLIARDPRWLFAYWDFDFARFHPSEMRYGYVQFFLKISREDGGQEASVEIKPEARNWYVAVNHPDTTYVAEIGYFGKEGEWRSVAASQRAHTPPDSLAADTNAVDFATVPAHLSFERLLELVQERMSDGETLIAALARVASEGRIEFRPGKEPTWTEEQKRVLAALLGDSLVDRMGLGSAELDELIRKQLQQKLFSESASGLSLGIGGELAPGTQSLFSAIGASWSAQPFSIRTERGFYMHVNAEIIFYGGTHPDAKVTLLGKEIALTPEGTFRYHYRLPDGDFELPIVATSPDKVEQRSATLSFKRGSERVGEVGASNQPPHLDPLAGRK